MTIVDRQLGDFAHVDEADAKDLVARLDAMHSLESFRTYKKETFDLLRLTPGAKVADVGCGTGEDVRTLAGLVGAGGEATGFDLSEAMLEQARDRHGATPGVSFHQAPADALSVLDNHFDAIRADRVLLHVPDPKAALDEMIRVTKSGGRIVIADPDMPGCWVASDDNDLTDKIMREIAISCVTPYLARNLWVAFKDAGLKDVTLTVRTVTVFDPASVGRILDFEGVIGAMLAKGQMNQKQAEGWIQEFTDRGLAGRFVAAVCIMIVAGTKP